MLQPVYWTNVEARTSEGQTENVAVIMWDWEAKQGVAVLNGERLDISMTDYSECDFSIGVKSNDCNPARSARLAGQVGAQVRPFFGRVV